MCGACGERGAVDWARPFLAGLPARGAIADAASRLVVRPGVRIAARGSGWLVSAPTGATVACSGLTELVTAVRPWIDVPREFAADRPSGPLTVPEPDARRGVVVRVVPGALSRPLTYGSGEVAVPDAEGALFVLSQLAHPPWSLRCYLAELSDVDTSWGGEPTVVDGKAAECGSTLVVWLECLRQLGEWDQAALVARCPLDAGRHLDVEIRAGHVVRARVGTVPAAFPDSSET